LAYSGQKNLGIKMAIVKQLVRLMRGDLGVNSNPDLGTTVWVEFKRTLV